MRGPRAWLAAWTRFFESIEEPLVDVMDASRCREGWVQAEAFRFFRPSGLDVSVNTLSAGGRRGTTFDFDCTTKGRRPRRVFIGELKILGEELSHPKVVTGAGLKWLGDRLRGDGPIIIEPTEEGLDSGWGLTKDYFRLKRFDAAPDLPVRMLMVAVRRSINPRPVGRVLRRIEFERRGKLLLDGENVWVKGWAFGGAA